MQDYSAKYAEQYQSGSFETALVAIRREQVLHAMARHPHRRVLEVGCGLEPLFTFVSGWESFTVVEPSVEFVAHARALASGRSDVRVVHGFLEDAVVEVAEIAPDFIAVSSLLHEVPDARALLRGVHAVSSADTVAHFNVPNVRSFHRLLALEMALIEDVFEPSEMELRFQRQRRFDGYSLAALVESEGFRVVSSGSYFVKPFTHSQMQAMLDGGIIDDRVLRGLEGMVQHLPGMGCEIFVDAVPR